MLSTQEQALPHTNRRRFEQLSGSYDLGDLLEACRRRDGDALAVLVARFQHMMENSARRYVTSPQDVEDAVQDAWVAFARSADTIHTAAAVGGWLRITTWRAALAIALRQVRVLPTAAVHDIAAAMPEDEPDLSHEMDVVRAAVLRLDPKDREIIHLLYRDGLSYAEIVCRTGRSAGAIGPTRQRAIDKLRHDRSIRTIVLDRLSA